MRKMYTHFINIIVMNNTHKTNIKKNPLPLITLTPTIQCVHTHSSSLGPHFSRIQSLIFKGLLFKSMTSFYYFLVTGQLFLLLNFFSFRLSYKMTTFIYFYPLHLHKGKERPHLKLALQVGRFPSPFFLCGT